MLTIKAGNYVLATYEYAGNNGKLLKLTYGNGDYEEYIYDILDRLVSVKLNGVTEYVVKYDSNGRLYSLTESGSTHIYEYDSLDRLVRAWQENASGSIVLAVENSYDDLGRSSGSVYTNVTTSALQYSITYKEDCNLVDTYTMPGNKVNTYTYDEFERLSQKTHSNNAYTTQYSYLTDSDGNTSSLVSRMDIDTSTTNTYYTYTYNNLGYISSISKNGSVIASYTYDALGQLTTEVNRETNRVYNYSYDKSGNILGKTVYNNSTAEVIERFTYTYGNSSWGDMLTNYNGTAITYDAIGNPINWRNATNMSWNGRELQSISLSDTKHMTFDYDSSGVRTRKTYVETNGNTWDYSYVLDGSKIIKETLRAYTTGSPAAGLTITLIYSYDDAGVASVMYNGTRYYYVKNLQGDIIGLVNSSGNYVVKYSYDAWGNIVSTTGSMASSLGDYNPFRYRSYYYDVETGFYYLQSRYYDPTVGRFINADGIIGANGGIEGYNMFAYCNNNPVMYCDPSGESLTELQFLSSLKTWINNVFPTFIMQVKLAILGFEDTSYQNAAELINAMSLCGVDTSEEKAHFLAQCAYETNYGTWLKEIGGPEYFEDSAYGYKYRGSGYLQMTWEDSYKRFSEVMGDDKILSLGADYVAENYAWQSAAWVWNEKKINEKIANGATVKEITKLIKGSYSTWEERNEIYEEFLEIFN